MIEILNDDPYLLIFTAILTICFQLFFFSIAFTFKFDLVTDFAGSLNFILIALVTYFINGEYKSRQIIVTTLVIISKLYLGSYLLYRVISRGSDARFDETRHKFLPFLIFWIFQMVWCYGVSLGVIYINTNNINSDLQLSDWIGIIIFVTGLFFEIIGDLQKNSFRSDPNNSKDFMSTGLWSISRHPNFFGEIIMWWGVFIIGLPLYNISNNWGYWTVISPLLTMIILLFLSGMPTCEGDSQKRFLKDAIIKERYIKYRNSTSILIPFPTTIYSKLPLIIKRIFFFEFKMYETDFNLPVEEPLIIDDKNQANNINSK